MSLSVFNRKFGLKYAPAAFLDADFGKCCWITKPDISLGNLRVFVFSSTGLSILGVISKKKNCKK